MANLSFRCRVIASWIPDLDRTGVVSWNKILLHSRQKNGCGPFDNLIIFFSSLFLSNLKQFKYNTQPTQNIQNKQKRSPWLPKCPIPPSPMSLTLGKRSEEERTTKKKLELSYFKSKSIIVWNTLLHHCPNINRLTNRYSLFFGSQILRYWARSKSNLWFQRWYGPNLGRSPQE